MKKNEKSSSIYIFLFTKKKKVKRYENQNTCVKLSISGLSVFF